MNKKKQFNKKNLWIVALDGRSEIIYSKQHLILMLLKKIYANIEVMDFEKIKHKGLH